MKKLLATVLIILATTLWAQEQPPYIYGPVEPGDNLWFIAKEFVEHYDVTTEEAVGLLFQHNIRAFMQGDVNSLMAGVFLTLPEDTPRRETESPESIDPVELALETDSGEEDVDEIKEQALEIAPPETVTQKVVVQEMVVNETALEEVVAEITPEIIPELPDVSEGTQVASLELLMPGTRAIENLLNVDELAFVNVLDDLKRDLSIAQEAIETERRAKDTLQSQLKDLQIQINALTELVTLKDQEMSAILNTVPPQLNSSAPATMNPSLWDKLPAGMLVFLQQAGENQMVLLLLAIAIAALIMYLWDSFAGRREHEQAMIAEPASPPPAYMDFATDENYGEHYEGDPPSDPIQTKLDLARAYLDIGDHENAVTILEEVMLEGSEQQITTAHMLLDNIKR